MGDAPNVLLLGGLGFIGQHLANYILEYQLASHLRIVDKVVPEMAYLSPSMKQAVQQHQASGVLDILQADLSVPQHVDRAFQYNTPGLQQRGFQLVINLASETQYGHMDLKYERNILCLRTACAAKAASLGTVERYIEVSTGQVYGTSSPAKESLAAEKLKPWTLMAKFHQEAEAEVVKQCASAMPITIVRLPIVYGPGDVRGLMPRIICAAVYEHTGTKMEFLWSEGLRMHTVHVQDAAAAIWFLCCLPGDSSGEIYNIVDENDTSQGSFNKILESLFCIKTGFHGTIKSSIATKINLEELVEEANAGHLAPWGVMCREQGIQNTPLTPYLEQELVLDNPLCLDGSKLKEKGFALSCPRMTNELVWDSLKYWKDMGMFPRGRNN